MKKFVRSFQIFSVLMLLFTVQLALGGVSGLQATSDVSNAYYQLNYTDSPAFLQVFLDTDKNASTGYQENGIGANYLLENNVLFRYSGTGSDWAWTLVKSSNLVKTATTAKWTVARVDLGSPASINVFGRMHPPLSSTSVVTQTMATAVVGQPINVSVAVSDGGYAYFIAQDFGLAADSSSGERSTLRVFEDGRELGPAHAIHSSIRTQGGGRFSHWTNGTTAGLYLSASNNTNPKTNGKRYTFLTSTAPAPTATPASTPAPSTSAMRVDYYGDSTIAGVTVAVPAPATFQADTGIPTRNEGKDGSYSTQLLNGTDGRHPEWSIQMTNSTATHVIINHALNDVANTSPTTYKSNLTQLARIAKSKGKTVIFETPNPTYLPDTVRTWANMMKEVATAEGVPVIDQFQMLTDYMVANKLTITQLCPDGVHPNQATYTLKGHYAAKRFLELFGSKPASTPAPTATPVATPAPTPVPATGSIASVSYVANSAYIPNPERGFYYMVNCDGGVTSSELQNLKTQGQTMNVCSFSLRAFINSAISQSSLDLLQRNLDTIRTAGMKTILRFTYSSDTNGVDATPARVLGHMDQLAPILSRNKDVIALMHAGFVGGWGEWAYSTNFGTGQVPQLTSRNLADRKSVIDKLMQILPADRMVQIRYPAHKMVYFGNAPLTSAEAHTGTPKARLAHHNDCFLASATDWGTWINASTEYPYMAAETQHLVMGGETCNPNTTRANCATALKELAMFHYSYLNSTYHQTVLNDFKAQGCYDTIKAKLGYRFVMKSGSFSTRVPAGSSVAVNFSLVNEGYAAPFNPRSVELVLRNTLSGQVFKIKLNTDLRRWLPGQTISVNQTVALPAGLPAGSYALLLSLPDASASLANRAEYSIQFANTNVWEASTGFNKLNHTLTVY